MRLSRPVLALMALTLLLTVGTRAAYPQQDIGQRMEREYGVLDRGTPEGRRLNDQLDRVVERIVAGVNAQRQSDFRLRSAKILGGRSDEQDRMVNAFALADGRIYVTLGLMRAVKDSPRSDDELAFVVGHEVVHVAEKHVQNQQQKALGAGLLATILGAVTRSDTVDTVLGLGAQAYVSSFGRRDEYRADRGGLMAMRAAGYQLQSAVHMLQRLQREGESRDRLINGWFGSHPLTENRIRRIEEMISELRAGREIRDRSENELRREDRRR